MRFSDHEKLASYRRKNVASLEVRLQQRQGEIRLRFRRVGVEIKSGRNGLVKPQNYGRKVMPARCRRPHRVIRTPCSEGEKQSVGGIILLDGRPDDRTTI